jgi:carboxypeptidase Q
MKRALPAAVALCAVVRSSLCAAAAETAADAVDPDIRARLERIREASTTSEWAWQQLGALTDRIGPRLSGSPQNAAAVAQVSAVMRALGAQVTLQPVKVPHWVRGEERAELTEYPGQPPGVAQHVRLTALGGSSATDAAGLERRVIVVRDFADLHAKAEQVAGNIVLFEERFDQRLADNGRAGSAYGQAVQYRNRGPSEAALLGAAAALVRSVGGADYRLPHTGATEWQPKQAPIPAAALAAEDADLIARLAKQGPVTIKLMLTPQTLPDADGANVIADWRGAALPDEFVIVSGHLDSWDLGTGATDDGVGVVAAAAVIQVLHELNLRARRTIRFVAWANEENGGRGRDEYFKSVNGALGHQCAAIESDSGSGHVLGISAAVSQESLAALKPVLDTLAPLGAVEQDRRTGTLGSDIAPLQEAGVPAFAPLLDTRHYFDYHHTAADTLDKVDPGNLKAQVAALAVLAYYLADMPTCLPRLTAR